MASDSLYNMSPGVFREASMLLLVEEIVNILRLKGEQPSQDFRRTCNETNTQASLYLIHLTFSVMPTFFKTLDTSTTQRNSSAKNKCVSYI